MARNRGENVGGTLGGDVVNRPGPNFLLSHNAVSYFYTYIHDIDNTKPIKPNGHMDLL